MKALREGFYSGERALYHSRDLEIYDSVFTDGESPLKESENIELYGCIFKWKYPLWYCKNVRAESTTILETARSGIWYTGNISMKNCTIEAPKTFRRAYGITLEDCTIPKAQETLWSCKDVRIDRVFAVGDYFGMNCEGVVANRLHIDGNYAFDGAKNVELRNSRLISKDAFWNCENVTVYDSLIIGEYLGWNSKNVRFVNCTVESNQGMCYMDGLVMENCRIINTDLAFEFSSVEVESVSSIVSVKNPICGSITASSIGKIILEPELIDPEKTIIKTEK